MISLENEGELPQSPKKAEIQFLETAGEFSVDDVVTIKGPKSDLRTVRVYSKDGKRIGESCKVSDFTDWKITTLLSDGKYEGRIIAHLSSDQFNSGLEIEDHKVLVVDLSEIEKA